MPDLRQEAYAVLRIDYFLPDSVPLEERLTIKEVLPTLEEAEREVARLNALEGNGADRSIYCWQYTRYYPKGRSVSS